MSCLRLGSVRDNLCLTHLIRALRGHRHVDEDCAEIVRLWGAFWVDEPRQRAEI